MQDNKKNVNEKRENKKEKMGYLMKKSYMKII